MTNTMYAASSGLLTSSTVVKAAQGFLCSVEVLTDGTNAATVTVYDSAAATTSGKTVLAKTIVAGAALHDGRDCTYPVVAREGLYVVISGTGAAAIVSFR